LLLRYKRSVSLLPKGLKSATEEGERAIEDSNPSSSEKTTLVTSMADATAAAAAAAAVCKTNLDSVTKSNLDNIVGSLWQARQESSGSSAGNQVRNIIIII